MSEEPVEMTLERLQKLLTVAELSVTRLQNVVALIDDPFGEYTELSVTERAVLTLATTETIDYACEYLGISTRTYTRMLERALKQVSEVEGVTLTKRDLPRLVIAKIRKETTNGTQPVR